MDWTTTYDEGRRKGFCSCGCWNFYGSRMDFDRAARLHLGVHARREKSAMPPRTTPTAFESTLADINSLPVVER